MYQGSRRVASRAPLPPGLVTAMAAHSRHSRSHLVEKKSIKKNIPLETHLRPEPLLTSPCPCHRQGNHPSSSSRRTIVDSPIVVVIIDINNKTYKELEHS